MAKMNLIVSHGKQKFSGIILSLKDAFPQVNHGVLSAIGYMGRKQLEFNLLNGQYIKLTKKPFDKKGRRTINYSMLPNLKGVKISAYPLNLHHPKKAYKKLSPIVGGQIDKVIERYDKNIFQKIIDDVDKK